MVWGMREGEEPGRFIVEHTLLESVLHVPYPQVGTPPKTQNCHYLLYTTKFLHYTFVCEVERVKKKDTEGDE